MSEFEQSQPRDAYFSKRIRAGKRTYYFDVKATRANDFYLTITESKRLPGESDDRPMFEKHKLFLYKEDFEKFADGFQEALNYISQKRNTEGYPASAITSDYSNHYDNNQPEAYQAEQNQISETVISEVAPTNGFAGIEFEDLGK